MFDLVLTALSPAIRPVVGCADAESQSANIWLLRSLRLCTSVGTWLLLSLLPEMSQLPQWGWSEESWGLMDSQAVEQANSQAVELVGKV